MYVIYIYNARRNLPFVCTVTLALSPLWFAGKIHVGSWEILSDFLEPWCAVCERVWVEWFIFV